MAPSGRTCGEFLPNSIPGTGRTPGTAPAVTMDDSCEDPPVTTLTADLEKDPATVYDWKAEPATFAAPTARISCDVSSF